MKKRITAIILTLCFTFILMPFSVIKARVDGPTLSGNINKGNERIGYYNNYFLYPDAGQQLETYIIHDISYQYSYASVLFINFNSYCTGTITITFDYFSEVDFYYVDGENVGSVIHPVNTENLSIYLNNSNHIEIYLFQEDSQYDTIPASFNTTNLTAGHILPDNYLTYQIPDDRFFAFECFLNVGDYIHYDDTTYYPYINVSNTKNFKIYVDNNDELYFAFLAPVGGPLQRTLTGHFTISKPSGSSISTTTISYKKYAQTNSSEALIVCKLTYTGNSGSLTFTPVLNNYKYRPIFIGKSSDYMSESTRGLLGLDELVNNPNEDMDDIADDLGDLHDEENDIIGGFESDLTDFNTDMDLDDYDFITDLTDSNTYFKMVLNDVFTNSSSVRAFWVIPLILVIITALLGR